MIYKASKLRAVFRSLTLMTATLTKPSVHAPDGPLAPAGSNQVNTRLPEDLNARLERYCKKYRVTKASVMKEGLIKELDRRERR